MAIFKHLIFKLSSNIYFATAVWPPSLTFSKTLTLWLVPVLLCWLCSLWPIEKRCKITSVGWFKSLEMYCQAVQDQLNRSTRSRFNPWGGCLLLASVLKSCRSCDAEVIVQLALSLFKRLRQSKAYLSTFVLTHSHIWSIFQNWKVWT